MGRRMQRIVIAVIAFALIVPLGAVGLARILGGDGEDPSQAASSAADTRPAVDPSSQPSPARTRAPAAPAELQVQSAEGAQATLRYLLDSYAYMMATGDTGPWTQSVDPNCQVCVQFLAAATQLHEQGGWGVGGAFTVTATDFQGTGEPPASGTVTATFTQAEQTIVDDPSRQAETEPALTGTIQARLVWDGERWRVGDMTMADVQQQGAGGASDGG